MAEKRVRIGFIGAGRISYQRHLPGLRAIDGVELVAVANRSRASGEKVAADWGFQTVCDEWNQVVDRADVDAVFIAAPPYLHAVATIAALEAGKHVFCQARMARDIAEARAMCESARGTDRVAMLCPSPTGLEVDPFVKRLIGEGYLGRLYEVHVRSLSDVYAVPGAPLHWRQDAFISGYNTLALGIHVETLHRWVGHFASMTAQVAYQITHRKTKDSEQTVEVAVADSVGVVATLKSGALATFQYSAVDRFGGGTRFEFFGSDGTLVYLPDQDRLLGAHTGEKELQPIDIPTSERRPWRAEADFVEAIRRGTPIWPDFEDGIRYMEFTEGVYRSAREGREIQLPLVDGVV